MTLELTQAERRVAALLVEGLSNVEIADRLCVSRNTVKAHMRHVLAKLGARNRVQAVIMLQTNPTLTKEQRSHQ